MIVLFVARCLVKKGGGGTLPNMEASIQAVRNKALKDIISVVEHDYDYCWQEETPEEHKLYRIESILSNLQRDIKHIKDKYKSRLST